MAALDRAKTWFDLRTIRSVAKNAGWLIGGNSFAAVVQLATLGIAARAIGVEGFGVLVLVTSYALFIEGLASSQSWQSLIKFGADARASGDLDSLKRVIKLCALFDAGGALIAACVAFLVAEPLGELVGWSDAVQQYAKWYSVVLLVHLSGAPTGIARLFGDFQRLAFQPVLAAGLRLIGVLYLALSDGPLWGYVFVWGLSDVVAQLRLMAIGYGCARRNSLADFALQPLKYDDSSTRTHLRFLLTTNLSGSVQLAVKRLDVLIVGSFLGEASAGIYRLIKMFAQIPSQVSGPFYQAVFPEIARYRAANDWAGFRSLVARLALWAGAAFTVFWLCFMIAGRPFIDHVFGPDFGPAWIPGTVYLLGVVVSGFALPLQPAVLAFGRAGLSLRAHIISNIVYLTVLLVTLPLIGLVAAGFSYLLYYLVWSTTMTLFLMRLLREQATD